ncbi:unnamed protein product, partial [Pylaiella littoralis]
THTTYRGVSIRKFEEEAVRGRQINLGHTKPVPKPKRQRKSTRGSFLSSTWRRLPAALPHWPSARAYLPRPALKPRGQTSNTPIPNVNCDEHRALHTISSTIHRLRSLFLEMLCA